MWVVIFLKSSFVRSDVMALEGGNVGVSVFRRQVMSCMQCDVLYGFESSCMVER